MDKLREIADTATNEINQVLTAPLSGEQAEKVERIVEQAVVKGLLEGQHRAIDATLQHPEAEQDIAHKIATAIRKKNDALIANLSSLR